MNDFVNHIDELYPNSSNTLRKYPEEFRIESDAEYNGIVGKFASQQEKQRRLFIEKHAHYGKSNILDGDSGDTNNIDESLRALYVRMRDKFNRFKVLIDRGVRSENFSDESLEDTLNDLANYCNISIIVSEGKWTEDE